MEVILIIEGKTVVPRYEHAMWRANVGDVEFISESLSQLLVGLREYDDSVQLADAPHQAESKES
jgi:hypothetical protein